MDDSRSRRGGRREKRGRRGKGERKRKRGEKYGSSVGELRRGQAWMEEWKEIFGQETNKASYCSDYLTVTRMDISRCGIKTNNI